MSNEVALITGGATGVGTQSSGKQLTSDQEEASVASMLSAFVLLLGFRAYIGNSPKNSAFSNEKVAPTTASPPD